MAKQKKLNLPAVLCGLGRAMEICVKGFVDGDHETFVYRWPAKMRVMLYSDTNGRTLYCVKTNKKNIDQDGFTKRVEQNRSAVAKGIKLYENWHDLEASNGCVIDLPKGKLYNVGCCTQIVYASDKWSGTKTKHYYHDFKQAPIVWVNNKKAPTVCVLTGGKIRVKKEGITG